MKIVMVMCFILRRGYQESAQSGWEATVASRGCARESRQRGWSPDARHGVRERERGALRVGPRLPAPTE